MYNEGYKPTSIYAEDEEEDNTAGKSDK